MCFYNRISLLVLFVLSLLSQVNARQNKAPNIIVILADDMGYGDLGCYNPQSKIPTPNMDKLARQGIRFTDAHSGASVCTPSRYSLITGRYAWRTALTKQVFYNYEPPLIEPSRMTIASLLKQQGYRTAAVGKWHIGLGWPLKPGTSFNMQKPLPWPGGTLPRQEEEKIDFKAPITGGPTELGFDYFFGSNACPTCNTPYCYIENNRVVEQPTAYYAGKYLEQRGGFRSADFDEKTVDSLYTAKAIQFIEQSTKSRSPFFLYLAASAPHEPAEEEVVPAFLRNKSKAGPRGDLVAYFDWMVGKIMAALQKTGADKNTLLIVTSDNGPKPGNFNRVTYGHKAAGDWRGFKGSVWEGGHRVPLIVRWPGKVKAGTVSEQLIGLQDLMATFAALHGVTLPDDAGEDSISFLDALLKPSGSGKQGRSDIIFHSTNGVFSIRKGPWKLIPDCDNSGDGGRGVHGNNGTGPDTTLASQLYHLENDPFELYNLAKRNAPMEQELRNLLTRYQQEGRSRPRTTK